MQVCIAFDGALLVTRITMPADRDAHRDAFAALGAMRAVNITAGTPKTVLNQVVIGAHVHIHVWIGKRADGLAVVEITARFRRRGEKVEFDLIVHALFSGAALVILDPKMPLVM